MSNVPVEDVFRRHVHMWNTGDLSEFDCVIAANYLGHLATGVRDRKGLRRRIEAFRATYPDAVFTIEDQFSSGDKVVTRLRARGTGNTDCVQTEMMGINFSRVAEQGGRAGWKMARTV